MVRHYMTFNGVNSSDFNVYISGGGTFNAPERDYEVISVSGRNGDLLLDNGRYENIEVTYPAFIVKGFDVNIEGMRDWLMSSVGYHRLEDTYHPDEYRIGRYKGGIDVSVKAGMRAGGFNLTFDCKPQRFLKSGEKFITVADGDVLINPSSMKALPIIRVYGAGTLGVGSETVTISAHSSAYMDIDCDLMDAHCGSANLNSYLSLSSGEFPSLDGKSGIDIGAGITKVEIMPRWWRL